MVWGIAIISDICRQPRRRSGLQRQRRGRGPAQAALDAEATQMEAVRSLLPRFEAKTQRVLDRVWSNGNAT